MLINFREDLQINLAREAPLPKGLQTSRSRITTDQVHEVYQMSRTTRVFSVHVCHSEIKMYVGDLPISKIIVM